MKKIYKLVTLLLGGSIFTSVFSSTATFAQPVEKTLTPFYRATQLQGHLIGMGLMEIPSYLFSSDVAFPYKRKAGEKEEIPFADTFTIVRFMGGYPEPWIKPLALFKANLGRASLDYAIKSPDGKYEYRSDLIRARLAPYLSAGYTPSDITIGLDNFPWDLSTPTGTAALAGTYGRQTPPGSFASWTDIVHHFALDMKQYLGLQASALTFETGVEYNNPNNFHASAEDFFQYYRVTESAVRSVLPSAGFNPGEFAGTGRCVTGDVHCVYDVKNFLNFARQAGIAPTVLPRSLQQLIDKGRPMPSAAIASLNASYENLGPVIREIHQFGLLDEPFGNDLGLDPGPRQASWIFQTLMRMLAEGPPRRVFHWGTFDQVGDHYLLNGTGFDMLMLDHYLGSRVLFLRATEKTQGNWRHETFAVDFQRGPQNAIVISTYTPDTGIHHQLVSVKLPFDNAFGKKGIRVVRYSEDSDVLSRIKKDLESQGNLQPQFESCSECVGSTLRMAKDQESARKMVSQNWPDYEAALETTLRWQDPGGSVQIHPGSLEASMSANEILVIEAK